MLASARVADDVKCKKIVVDNLTAMPPSKIHSTAMAARRMCCELNQVYIKSCALHCDVGRKAGAKEKIIHSMGLHMRSGCEAHMVDSMVGRFGGGGHDVLDNDGVQQNDVALKKRSRPMLKRPPPSPKEDATRKRKYGKHENEG